MQVLQVGLIGVGLVAALWIISVGAVERNAREACFSEVEAAAMIEAHQKLTSEAEALRLANSKLMEEAIEFQAELSRSQREIEQYENEVPQDPLCRVSDDLLGRMRAN